MFGHKLWEDTGKTEIADTQSQNGLFVLSAMKNMNLKMDLHICGKGLYRTVPTAATCMDYM